MCDVATTRATRRAGGGTTTKAAARSRGSSVALSELEDFEVFGGVPPSRWLGSRSSSAWAASAAGGARCALRRRLPLAVRAEAASFLQLQALQRGTGVMPHIDAATPRAEVVATVGLRGHCTVRVGHVELEVGVGDVYCLEGRARWKVKHEVLPSRVDRLSVTIVPEAPQTARRPRSRAGLDPPPPRGLVGGGVRCGAMSLKWDRKGCPPPRR